MSIISILKKDIDLVHHITDESIYIGGLDVNRRAEYIKDGAVDLEINFPPFSFTLKWDTADSESTSTDENRVEEITTFNEYIDFLTNVYLNVTYNLLSDNWYLCIISKREIDFSKNIVYDTPSELLKRLTESRQYRIIDIYNWQLPNSMRCRSWYMYRSKGSHRTTYSMYQVLVFEKVSKNKTTLKARDASEDYTTELLNEMRTGLVLSGRSNMGNKYKNIIGKNQLASDRLVETLIKLFSNKGEIVSDSFGWLGHHGLLAIKHWRKALVSELLTTYTEQWISELPTELKNHKEFKMK